MNPQKYLLVVCGPTASGKTGLAIQLAQHYKTEILSADSRQFYKEIAIGTAKPTTEELAAAKHHFIDSLSIEESYSVGQYERDAIALLDTLYIDKDILVLVGGSGLFIDAVCKGLDHYPDVPADIREQLQAEHAELGLAPLLEELQAADPNYYQKVDRQNPHRVLRALEVFRASGQPFSSFQGKKAVSRNFIPIKISLDWEREKLYDRINRRVDLMLEANLLAEVKRVYPQKALNSLQTVGYQELFNHFDGLIDLQEAIRLIKRNTRRYAKRQMTWFRKDAEIQYFKPGDFDAVLHYVERVVGC